MLRTQGQGQLTIPYRIVAIASLILTLTCLTTVVVVVSSKDADALSTVALSLAIIAFVVQIIVFIVQMTSASDQMVQAQQLYGSMRGLIGQIEERTAGTQASVQLMSDRMLEHVLGRAMQDTEESGLHVGNPGFTTSVAQRAAELASESEPPDFPPRTSSVEEDMRVLAKLASLPADPGEVRTSLATLLNLTDLELRDLWRFVRDEVQYRQPNRSTGPGLPSSYVQMGLVEKGLLEALDWVSNGQSFLGLSEAGRDAGRLLAAPGPIPDGLPELEQIRARFGVENPT
jgi:heme/copper-type cytochrome/quinol oxidase subunit 4